MFPTFILDERLKVLPGPSTPTFNFSILKEILLSTDLSRNKELDWSKNLRFLDKTVDLAGNRICILSYPRTINTMTRTYIEQVTGIYTGSDMNLITSNMLQSMGMAGEEHVSSDNTVWVTKSHYPDKDMIADRVQTFDKAIVVTRNPIDTLVSYFLLLQTASHSAQVKKLVNEAFPSEWDGWVRSFTIQFKQWHDWVCNELPKHVPVYFVRYEDQTTKSLETTLGFFRFMLGDITGTVLEHRIEEVTKQSCEQKQVYKLKSNQTLNRNRHKYNNEQICFIE
jgi:hypothetical protein